MFIFPFATLDNDEDEIIVAGFIGEDLDYLILLKTRDKPGPRQAILMLAVTILIIIYHACFLLLKLYKNCLNKTIFDVAITTIIIIRIIIMPVVKTWCYQAHSHHMVYLPSKYT